MNDLKPIYEWKVNSFNGSNAQEIGDYLEKIKEENNGILSQDLIVKNAEHIKSPLYKCFEWNDEKAGHAYRLDIAGKMLRLLVVVKYGEEKVDVPIRAFLNIKKNSIRYYETTAKVLNDIDLRQQILEQAKQEIKIWREKYSQYKEFSSLFDFIDETTLIFPQEKLLKAQ